MVYLQPDEYGLFGLSDATSDALVSAASGLIDAHCHRDGIGVAQYTERLRFAPGSLTVRLSALPLAVVAPATSALVSVRARLARCADESWVDPLREAFLAFGCEATWIAVDVATVDVSAAGELTLPMYALGVPYDVVEVVYTAGWAVVPDVVKQACAQIVRNAQSTPALNVSGTKVDAMQVEYFKGSLMDADTTALLKDFVATRLG